MQWNQLTQASTIQPFFIPPVPSGCSMQDFSLNMNLDEAMVKTAVASHSKHITETTVDNSRHINQTVDSLDPSASVLPSSYHDFQDPQLPINKLRIHTLYMDEIFAVDSFPHASMDVSSSS